MTRRLHFKGWISDGRTFARGRDEKSLDAHIQLCKCRDAWTETTKLYTCSCVSMAYALSVQKNAAILQRWKCCDSSSVLPKSAAILPRFSSDLSQTGKLAAKFAICTSEIETRRFFCDWDFLGALFLCALVVLVVTSCMSLQAKMSSRGRWELSLPYSGSFDWK